MNWSSMWNLTLQLCLWWMLGLSAVSAHPQCLDFRPPFEARSPLQFCGNYTEFGCCTVDDDHTLYEQFLGLRDTLSTSDWNRCSGYLQELMCQSCSPYAAHIYDAERTMRARTFPGLCTDYCLEFVRDCADIIPLLDPSLTGSRLLRHDHVFCQHVALTDVDYCYPDLLTSPVLNGELQVQRETTEGCLCLEPVMQNLTSALFARHAGDGTGRLFIAEQPGVVRILYPDSKRLLPRPFLNIKSRVKVSRSAGDERGLLGLAFHPRFSQNGRFFVYYTTRLSEDDVIPPEDEALGIDYLDHKVRISEMRVSAGDPNRADPSYERILMEIGQPYSNHNGGELLFVDDGYLYIFVGDGGAAGDPFNAAQNKTTLLGKVLRVDVDSRPDLPYSIPADNPFVHEQGTRHEIFALGVRNIWRCGVDSGDRKTGAKRGRVLCGDVGQNAHEEVDMLRAGANYGWRAKEGVECYDEEMCYQPIEDEELPVHTYPHSLGKSVTGGHFYRGCESPALDGQYIYGDYVSGRLFSLEENQSGEWTNKDITLCDTDVCFNGLTNDHDVHIFSFGQDENGEVYMLTTPSSRPRRADGRIFKVVDPLRRGDPSDCPSGSSRNRVPVNPTRPRVTVNPTRPRVTVNPTRPRVTVNPTRPRVNEETGQRGRPRGRRPACSHVSQRSPNTAAGVTVQGPSIQQIMVRVCGSGPSFLCNVLALRAGIGRNG